jgi:threonine aldolase
MRTFRSDNNAGICPEALHAIIDANEGHHIGYGDDDYTAHAVAEFRRLFGEDTAVFLVATGTAANTLAIASLTQPWQQVICHAHSHYNDDESTAPERITHCRVSSIHSESGKIAPADIESAAATRGDVHQPQPGVVSISNPTEFGTVYSAAEVKSLCETAHALGYRVHVDGARFANAAAYLGCDPRAIAGSAGVDALSFGGTKNALAFGEAVLFFPQGDRNSFKAAAAAFPFHRKGTGHLLSKHRFVAAAFAATLRDGSWLRHADHANTMARRLAQDLQALGVNSRFPVEANGVFVSMAPELASALRDRGHGFYPFGEASWNVVRLMCSFDTQPEDIDAFVRDVAELLGR